ncbi:polysaccharide deacetylase family protein [Candidatus Woesearchaeota archaeon]|jgi:peptidoglycan/xylan/chitin deacetylase (PgdA/CDA1 family)|nr:polysaccharide deacetylase family protein [Candidatus Woesearchaeota archaeon]MBT5739535.1 polysaccharide deacetylase family protein [Candidatus Woesearchaeota archaeon]
MKTRIMTVDLENDLQSQQCVSIHKIVPKLLNYFDDNKIKATFFTVSNLLEKYESEIKEIAKKHEIASHSYTHPWLNKNNAEFEIKTSKEKFEEFNINIKGFRAPGMIITKDHFKLLKKHNYSYDSSIGKFFPGRYQNLSSPQKPFIKENLPELPIPTTIYPFINSGLSYLKLFHPVSKLFPKKYMFYLHPWEFLEKKDLPKNNSMISNFLRRNSGKKAWNIFEKHINKSNSKWTSCQDYLNKNKLL